jgi:AraC-like DNA-binding protein
MAGESYPKVYLYRRIVNAKLFIEQNYASAIALNDISDEAYFSKYHFIRLFKKIYGKTPHQYLTAIRIDKAKLLLATNLSVTEVCYAVGFESLTSFTALFKRYTKVSPSFYQQKAILRQQEIASKPLNFIPNCFAEQKGWRG